MASRSKEEAACKDTQEAQHWRPTSHCPAAAPAPSGCSAAGSAAGSALHTRLWLRQSARWHAGPQYQMARQRVQQRSGAPALRGVLEQGAWLQMRPVRPARIRASRASAVRPAACSVHASSSLDTAASKASLGCASRTSIARRSSVSASSSCPRLRSRLPRELTVVQVRMSRGPYTRSLYASTSRCRRSDSCKEAMGGARHAEPAQRAVDASQQQCRGGAAQAILTSGSVSLSASARLCFDSCVGMAFSPNAAWSASGEEGPNI